MPTRILLTASAVLALSGAALAQETAPAAPAPAPAPAQPPSAEDAAFEARAERFEVQMDEMSREIEAAVEASGGDRDTALASVDDILARHRPEIEGFADDLDAYLAAQETLAGADSHAAAQLAAARGAAVPVVRAIPDQVRAGVERSLTQPQPQPQAQPQADAEAPASR